jgi:hypothetical protein
MSVKKERKDGDFLQKVTKKTKVLTGLGCAIAIAEFTPQALERASLARPW